MIEISREQFEELVQEAAEAVILDLLDKPGEAPSIDRVYEVLKARHPKLLRACGEVGTVGSILDAAAREARRN